MFILPLSHEKETVRRWPVISLGIITLCFFGFFTERHVSETSNQRIEVAQRELFDYYAEHPYLQLDSKLMSKIFPLFQTMDRDDLGGGDAYDDSADEADDGFGESYEQEDGFSDAIGYFGSSRFRPPGPRTLKKQQERLDELSGALLAELKDRPLERWGLVPADKDVNSLITHMFMHAGWLHLLGNLFFLYLTGPFIEDLWGRPIFAVFYLGAGVFAASMYALQVPGSQVPLIGASGAVAGLMGAFMVRYSRTRIRFFYFLWFFRIYTGTFWAPAVLMLPLWFAGELWSAYLMDAVSPGAGGGGTAHWAHVWGFLLGAGVAALAAVFKLEQRHTRVAIDPDLEILENSVVEQAHEEIEEGRIDEAWRLLEEEVRRRPSNRDAAMALWDLAVKEGRTQEAASAMGAVVRSELTAGDDEMGVYHWHELKSHVPSYSPELTLKVRIAEGLSYVNEGEEARELLQGAMVEVGPGTGPGAVRRLAEAAGKVDPVFGGQIARTLLDKCELPAQVESRLHALIEKGSEVARESGDVLLPLPGESGFRVLEGRPTGLSATTLDLEMESGKAARLHYDQIRAVAVGGIREEGASRPYLVIDFFLDPPGLEDPGARVVRCLSRGFNPMKLVPEATSPKAAIGGIVERVLGGGATPLLGSESMATGPIKIYPTVAGYEAALRG